MGAADKMRIDWWNLLWPFLNDLPALSPRRLISRKPKSFRSDLAPQSGCEG